MVINPLGNLLGFLSELDRRKIFFKRTGVRDEAIMVEIAGPGERWEVEFLCDGQVEVEVFIWPSREAALHGSYE
jgi:hypothetical protein